MEKVNVTVWVVCFAIVIIFTFLTFRETPFLEICNCVNDRCKVTHLYTAMPKQYSEFSQSTFRESARNVNSYVYYDKPYGGSSSRYKSYEARYYISPFYSGYNYGWTAEAAVKKIKQNKDICVVKVAGNFIGLLLLTIFIIIACILDIRWQRSVLLIFNPPKKKIKKQK